MLRDASSGLLPTPRHSTGDPCPRAWSAVDPRAVIREAAEAMKEQLKETMTS